MTDQTAPLVLIGCGWPRDRALIGTLLHDLGAEGRTFPGPAEAATLLASGAVELIVVDCAAGLATLSDQLRILDAQPEAHDLPVVFLADPTELLSMSELIARRFNAVLLTKPVEREQLVAAIRSGLRYQRRQRQNRELLVQLAAANAELERRRSEAADEALRKTRFLAAISHDIRTPVNAMVLSCQLLQMMGDGQAPPEETRELTDGLHASATSLIELVNDLLDIARYDQDRLEFTVVDFAPEAVLGRTLDNLRPLAEQKGLSLTSEVASGGLLVRSDAVKFARVVQNLVSNAIKFTESGSVRVEARADRRRGLVVDVIDTGLGVPAELRETIFDEFQQLRNPERDRTKGTGLGLAICRRLVDAMGGTIGVATPAGHAGSVFRFELPASRLVPEAAAPAAAPPEPEPEPDAAPRASLEGRVLIAEDHEPSRHVLGRMLRRFGLTVQQVSDGREALDQVARDRPDVLLLDLMMPDIGGMEVMRAIRSDPALSGLRIIILTGDLGDRREDDLVAAGADGCLGKPVDLDELLALLDRLLPRVGQAVAAD